MRFVLVANPFNEVVSIGDDGRVRVWNIITGPGGRKLRGGRSGRGTTKLTWMDASMRRKGKLEVRMRRMMCAAGARRNK